MIKITIGESVKTAILDDQKKIIELELAGTARKQTNQAVFETAVTDARDKKSLDTSGLSGTEFYAEYMSMLVLELDEKQAETGMLIEYMLLNNKISNHLKYATVRKLHKFKEYFTQGDLGKCKDEKEYKALGVTAETAYEDEVLTAYESFVKIINKRPKNSDQLEGLAGVLKIMTKRAKKEEKKAEKK